MEQNTRAALTVAQRGYVLATGRVVYEGSAEQLVQSEMVQQAFVGARPLGLGDRKGRRQRRLEQADEARHG